MKPSIPLFVVLVALWSCDEENTCKRVVNGVYVYPQLPSEHNMTVPEVDEYIDIPVETLACLNTDGLIQTCLNYPNLGVIFAGSSLQSGYDLVKHKFRGLRELAQRKDRASQLIAVYQLMDPLGYDPDWDLVDIGLFTFKNDLFEVIISQYSILTYLSHDEKVELAQAALRIYREKQPDFGVNQSLFDLVCTSAVVARLMYLDKFPPYLEVYQNNELHFYLAEYYSGYEIATPEEVIAIAEDYLLLLQQN